MIPNPWILVGFGVILIASVLGAFHVGQVYERAGFIEADLKRADKVIVKQEFIIREVPKIVTKVVTQEKVIEKEVDRVIAQIPHMLDPDCVLPDDFGLLLVAASNGIDPTTAGSADAVAGQYGCREVLAAVLTDLRAGWRNSARLEGLQGWAQLVTQPLDKGAPP